MKAAYIRLAALVLFVVSYFLPAIQMGTSGPGSGPLAGWGCAFVASVMAPVALIKSLGQGVDTNELLIPVSGLVNYLFVAVCVLGFWTRFRRTRLVLAGLMLPCFAATWIFFASSKTKPLAGHFLWIGACVLLVIPDVVNALRKTEESTAEAAGESDGLSAGR
jgi:hypothetical protein